MEFCKSPGLATGLADSVPVMNMSSNEFKATLRACMSEIMTGSEMREIFATIASSIVEAAVTPLRSNIAQLQEQVNKQDLVISCLKNEINDLYNKQDLEDQNKRKTNVIVNASWSDAADQSARDQVCNFICDTLQIPALCEEISECYRIGKKKMFNVAAADSSEGMTTRNAGVRNRPICVSFFSLGAKIDFVKAARTAKTGKSVNPVYINDDLSNTRMRAFKHGLDLKKRRAITDVRLQSGNIKVILNNRSVRLLTTYTECVQFLQSIDL